MKGAKSKSGPVKELSALHSDGRPMTLSLQVWKCVGGVAAAAAVLVTGINLPFIMHVTPPLTAPLVTAWRSSGIHGSCPLRAMHMHHDAKNAFANFHSNVWHTTSQAALKDGNMESRLVLAIRSVKPATGAPHMLSRLIAAEAAEASGTEVATAAQAVPGLALDKVGRLFVDSYVLHEVRSNSTESRCSVDVQHPQMSTQVNLC